MYLPQEEKLQFTKYAPNALPDTKNAILKWLLFWYLKLSIWLHVVKLK